MKVRPAGLPPGEQGPTRPARPTRGSRPTPWARLTLGLALAALLACGGDAAPEAAGPLVFPGANLVLISIDTLRADRVGTYGYDRGTTPRLDAFASEAVVFEDMYSNSPKTASSHMSLFTGMLPSSHKVRNQSARLGLASPVLADNRLTFTQVLRRSGYWNAAVTCGANLDPRLGFAKGFGQRYVAEPRDVVELADRLLDDVEAWLAGTQPGFFFLHTYQVHGPYVPPAEEEARFAPEPSGVMATRMPHFRGLPFAQQWKNMNKGLGYWDGKEDFGEAEAAYLSDLYDGEVAYTDRVLGDFLDRLDEMGVLDTSIVVVLSDHGEEFFEHGGFEHDQLFREHLHVPCLVRLPGGRLGGTRVKGQASLIDVAPTLLELLGQEIPPTVEGTSLVPAMAGGRTDDLPVVAERVMFPDDYKATVRTGRAALTFHATPRTLTAFDLGSDPAEEDDQVGAEPEPDWVSDMAGLLRGILGRTFQRRELLDEVDAGGTVTVDATQVEELRAMGYLGDDTDDGVIPEGTPLERWPEDR